MHGERGGEFVDQTADVGVGGNAHGGLFENRVA
jgi:hypothetical protein